MWFLQDPIKVNRVYQGYRVCMGHQVLPESVTVHSLLVVVPEKALSVFTALNCKGSLSDLFWFSPCVESRKIESNKSENVLCLRSDSMSAGKSCQLEKPGQLQIQNFLRRLGTGGGATSKLEFSRYCKI